MHVDDVGADPDMHGDRQSEPGRRREQAQFPVRGLAVVQPSANGLTDAKALAHPLVDRGVQKPPGLVGHSEESRSECFVHLFRGAARQRQLEVVNDDSAVDCEG